MRQRHLEATQGKYHRDTGHQLLQVFQRGWAFSFQSASLRRLTLPQKSGSLSRKVRAILRDERFHSEDQNRKRAILLHSCGKQTYHLLRSMVSPRKPAETPNEQLCVRRSRKVRLHCGIGVIRIDPDVLCERGNA